MHDIAATGHIAGTQKSTTDFDTKIGARVRLARIVKGISQETLGQRLGITFQQVQKYEKGTNRISAGRLVAISGALGMPISYFYEAAEAETPAVPFLSNALNNPDCVALARDFDRIGDRGVRRAIANLVRASAGEEKEPA